jgi:uncharacterized membrane protein
MMWDVFVGLDLLVSTMEVAMPRMVLIAAISLAASLGLSANAHATHWTVCNKTPEDLNVAIAFIDNENHTAVEGWHGLHKCGGCAVVLNFDDTQKENVWLFAKNNNDIPRFQSAHPRLCVFDHQAFRHRIVGGVACPAGSRTVGFNQVTLFDQNVNRTTNLTPASGAPVCFND